MDRQIFFTGKVSDSETDNIPATMLFDVIRFTIWQKRLQNENLSYYTLENEVANLIDQICSTCNKTKYLFLNCSFINLDGQARGGDWNAQPP
jgi:hypothetical protein